jgi:hypothetical protein
MIDPKELAKGGFGAAAARRREREAERATERQRGTPSTLPVADALPGRAPAQDEPLMPAHDQPTTPVRDAALESASADKTTRRPDARGA